jgi:hypothetical protein
MAKEIKSISVPPSAEEETINVWQTFGWEFKSTQEVKTQDVQVFTGQDSDGTEHYRTTRGEHYVKLTFERDPTRENYAELVSLERQYNAVPGPGAPPVRFGKLWTIISGIGLFLWVVPGVIIIIWRCVSYSKKSKQWNADYDNWASKRAEILRKAKPLS